MINILLSYPRSGNHLVRFFIELLTETKTNGCKGNRSGKDLPVYKNKYEIEVPFNINEENSKENIIEYYKYHNSFEIKDPINKLILIIRNPREVLLRHHDNKMVYTDKLDSFDKYFESIDFYNKSECKKILFFYEDIITNKNEFINDLYNFLEYDNQSKLNYVLENIELLYKTCACATNRGWGGINSDSVNYYYPKLDSETKIIFDKYINEMLSKEKYLFLASKYNIQLDSIQYITNNTNNTNN
jgi:hypothetical protein